MVSDDFFFMSESPIHFIKCYIRDKEPLINIIDFFKKSSKSLTCNFLYYYLRFCTLTKNLNTERTLLKCNKTCCPVFHLVKIFVSFYQAIKRQPRRVAFSLVMQNKFFDDDSEWTENTIVVLLSGMITNKLFCAIANIQLRKFRFKKGVELV